jgi:Tfp pilus assembly protein PilN
VIRINLLPKAPARRISGRPLFEIGIPLVVLAVVVFWYLVLSGQVKDLKGEIQETDRLIAELQPQVARVEELKRQIEAARAKEKLLAGLLATQMPASSILTTVRVLINGAPIATVVSERRARDVALHPTSFEDRPEGLARDRWDVAIETTTGTVLVECGAIRERVSQELARAIFEAVRRAVEA